MITVLVAARRAAARARLEALVAGSRAVRLIAAPPGMPLGEQVRTLRPDVVLVDLDGERIDTALHGLRSARAGIIVLDDDPRQALVDEPAVRGLLRGVLPRDAGAGDQQLVVPCPIEVPGVEERDPRIERSMDGGDALGLVGRTVQVGHSHAAETQGGDSGAVRAERPSDHAVLPSPG